MPIICSKITAICSLIFFLVGIFANDSFGQSAQSKSTWQLLCESGTCRMYSDAISHDGNVVSSISLQFAEGRKLYGILTLPHGIHIPSGVVVTIDNTVSFQPKLIDCLKSFCRAVFGADKDILSALINGRKSYITVIDSGSHQTVSIEFLLQGFKSTYKKYRDQYLGLSKYQLRQSITN